MTHEHAATREELIQYIHNCRPHLMGSATREGTLYQEIPFAGYEKLPVHRMYSAERARLVSEHLDLHGKTVLDVGCNIGYFCFEFARLGATCWGLDYDEDAIFIARSLKHIHGVEDVHFFNREFSAQTISFLLGQADKFDVILLNSVIHWLLYNNLGSMRRLASLLNLLISPEKQFIVYEPSSSGRAYYPEVLSRRGVDRFFHLLGASSYRQLGKLLASNTRRRRDIWLGERDVHAVIRETDGLLAQQQPVVGQKIGPLRVVHTKRDKVCLRYGNLFIKTVATAGSNHNFLLRNELSAVRKLSRYAEYMPVLILGTEFGGRVYLVYEWVGGRLLANTLVTKRDMIWIARELIQFLHVLKWEGLAHNDLRPQNVFLLSRSKSILIIDYEHSGPRFSLKDRPEHMDQLLLTPPVSAEEKRVLADQLPRLGGKMGSPYGPGCYENDYYIVNRMIFDYRNRRRYARLVLVRIRDQLWGWLVRTWLGRKLSVLRRSSTQVEQSHSSRALADERDVG